VEDDHSLTDEVAVQGPRDAFAAAGTELEQTATEHPRMRHPQVGAELHQQLDESRVVGKDADGPPFDLSEDTLVEVLDGVRLVPKLANPLTTVKSDRHASR